MMSCLCHTRLMHGNVTYFSEWLSIDFSIFLQSITNFYFFDLKKTISITSFTHKKNNKNALVFVTYMVQWKLIYVKREELSALTPFKLFIYEEKNVVYLFFLI